MKKTVLLSLIAGLILPMVGFSQLEKGDLMNSFSAGLSYYHRNFKDISESKVNDIAFALNDNLGMFIIDKLAIGPGLTFSLENLHETSPGDGGDNKYNLFTYGVFLSPFARYYFAQTGKLAFFAQVSGTIGYTHDKYKTQPFDQEETESTLGSLAYGGGLGIGLNYFFNDNIALESQLSYSFIAKTNKYDFETFDETGHVNTGTVLLSVGMNFFLQP